jgi:hypothetical protein
VNDARIPTEAEPLRWSLRAPGVLQGRAPIVADSSVSINVWIHPFSRDPDTFIPGTDLERVRDFE